MGRSTTTTGAVFIPEIWQDEIRRFLMARLRIGNLIKHFDHEGQPGDILHVPDVSEITANDMGETGEVNAQSVTEGEFTLTIDKWKESSFRLNDLLRVQSAYEFMTEYTRSAGYAIGKQYEIDIFNTILGATGTAVTGYDGDGTALTDGGNVITRDGILQAVEDLDTSDVPEEDRWIVIPPAAKKSMLGIDNFISADYISGRPIVTGQFGEIFGMPVVLSTLIPEKTNGQSAENDQVIIGHREVAATAVQKNLRSQSDYELSKLSTLVVNDMIYGNKIYRTDHAIILRLT